MNKVSIWIEEKGDLCYSASIYTFHKVYAALFMDLTRQPIMNGR